MSKCAKDQKILAVQWESVSLHHFLHEEKVRVMWPAITSSIDLSVASLCEHVTHWKKKTFRRNHKKKKKDATVGAVKTFYSNLKPQSNPASCLDLRPPPPRRLRLGGEEPSEPGARHFPRTFSHWQLRLPSIPRCRPRGAWPRHWSLRTSRPPPPHILTFDPTGGNNKGESKDFLRVVDCSDDTFNLTLAPNFTILLTDVWNFLVEYREWRENRE